MILVTGANGQLGRHIINHLVLRLGSSAGLAVSVRDTAKAHDLSLRGIDVRHGDFDQPETLAKAFAGIDKLVLVSTDGPRDVRIAQHRAAIAAARAAGVAHILYTSFVAVSADSPAEFSAVHRATESDLCSSGIRHTLLRNTLYADFLPMTLGAAAHGGSFSLPAGTGKVSFVSRAELADAIAAAAVAPALAKDIYELTGQIAHDYHEVAEAVSQVTGKAIRYEPISEDTYARMLQGHGLPEWLARAMGNMYSAVAAEKFNRVSNDFAALVGHPPRPLACLAQELFAA